MCGDDMMMMTSLARSTVSVGCACILDYRILLNCPSTTQWRRGPVLAVEGRGAGPHDALLLLLEEETGEGARMLARRLL